jgi:hypothetical protein
MTTTITIPVLAAATTLEACVNRRHYYLRKANTLQSLPDPNSTNRNAPRRLYLRCRASELDQTIAALQEALKKAE